jgi:hypothetical protein
MSERKWWLVSDEALKAVQAALEAPTHEKSFDNCENHPRQASRWEHVAETCDGCDGDELRVKALHELACGTHETDTVPGDFKKEPEDEQTQP